jgi:REP element-mobilizing transposase RayT
LYLGEEVKVLMNEIAKKYNFEMIETEVDKNYIHLLISYEPKMSILEVARLLKQMTIFIYRKNIRAFWKNISVRKELFEVMVILLV